MKQFKNLFLILNDLYQLVKEYKKRYLFFVLFFIDISITNKISSEFEFKTTFEVLILNDSSLLVVSFDTVSLLVPIFMAQPNTKDSDRV